MLFMLWLRRHSALWCSGGQAKSALVVPAAAILEYGLGRRFDLASILEQHGIGAVLIVADAALYRIDVQDPGMTCEEGVDPPTRS
jgi:hypothetical protein